MVHTNLEYYYYCQNQNYPNYHYLHHYLLCCKGLHLGLGSLADSLYRVVDALLILNKFKKNIETQQVQSNPSQHDNFKYNAIEQKCYFDSNIFS